MNDLRSAASLILMRDRAGAPPEILICKRADALAFAAGAYVFPGGRVEEGDAAIGARLCPDAGEDGAARVAALRETFEETGIGGSLAAGAPWIDPAALVPFARWVPPPALHRRYDTRFFLAMSETGEAPVADGREMVACFWSTAADVLARIADGEGRALYPTRRMLERLADFASFGEAVTQARSLPSRIITPVVEERADGRWLCIPDDAGYPVTAERIESAMRA